MRISLRKWLVIFASCLGIGTAAAAQPTFYARQDIDGYIVCQAPQGTVLIADVNGDGNPDVVCNPMLLGNGDGTFRQGPALVIPYETQLGQPIALDVNGDGKVDLVYAAYDRNLLGIAVMLGNGDGSFQNAIFFLSQVNDAVKIDNGAPVVSGDFNGDGIQDLAVLGTQEIVIFTGRRGGSFKAGPSIPLTYTRNERSYDLAVVDENGDGRLDLVVNAVSAIEVLLGNGDGSFQNPITTKTATNAGFGAFAVGDLNEDGIPDVVLQSINAGSALMFIARGDGTFRTSYSVSLPGNGPTQALAIADVNGDGVADLLGDLVEVLLGTGRGKFATPVYYPTAGIGLAPGGAGIGVADLRHSGKLDVVTSNAGGGISILLNVGKGEYEDGVPTTVAGNYNACAASGDFNGDGIPDIVFSNNAALQIYLGTGKPSSPFVAGAMYPVTSADCPVVGDLNGDGAVDILIESDPPQGTAVVIGFLGNGDGSFRQGPSSQITGLGFIALGDFNGDGKLDYATTTNLVAYGNGDGSFGTPFPYISNVGSGNLFGIASADLNGDGLSDVVLTNPNDGQFYVLLSNGTGGFQEIVTPANGCGEPSYLGLGDLNGDGKPDVALSCEFGAGVFLNDGSGKMVDYSLLGIPNEGWPGNHVVISDLNGDGIGDVALQGYSNIAVYLGQGSNTFAAPLIFGTANSPVGLFALNTHGQNPSQGTPDLIEVDESGLAYTLVNRTQ